MRPLPALAGALCLLLAAAPLRADLAASESAIRDLGADVLELARQAEVRIGEDEARYVEDRLADADMFFRLGFYEEASLLYLDIVDNYPQQVAYADALFRLAESLYQAEDPFGARDFFERIIERAGEVRFRPYLQQALGRLIELAIRAEDFGGIERYFAELNRLPPGDVADITAYYRGKYHYFRGNYAEAERSFLAVPETSDYLLEARYFLGVVYTARREFDRALQAFEGVLRSPAADDQDRDVVDLTHLAVGRLRHEAQREDEAILSYQQVSTESRFFDRALYEVAWVHLARGDTTKARRALELLIIYDPNSRHAADARLLLGNILLREGRVVSNEECFLLNAERLAAQAAAGPDAPPPDDLPPACIETARATTDYAVDAFQAVKIAYGPVFDGLARAMASREDLRAFFRDMVRSDVPAVTAPSFLPPEARAWFESHQGISQVQDVLESLSTVRRYLAETERLVTQLEAILSGRSTVGAFSELRGVRDRTVSLANRIARIRADLATERDRLVAAPAGEAANVRARRQEVEREVRNLPLDGEAMAAQNERQQTGIGDLSHDLTETAHYVELLESMASALDQYLLEPANWGEMTEADVEAIRAELGIVRGAVGNYRLQADDLRRRVDVLRAQVQVGEISAETARALREQHRELVAFETRLLGGAPSAARVNSALDSLDAAERDLEQVLATLERRAGDRSRSLLDRVRTERANLDTYRNRLAAVEAVAEDVIGSYAFQNFEEIADRFEVLMLRSDVGVADSAWSLAEEHRNRMIQMGRQRDRDLEAIQMEYDDLLGN